SRAAAPAKLNLYLRVVGRRANGYHLLDSLVAFCDLADTVEVAPCERLELACDGPFAGEAGPTEENLVHRAATLLAREAGIVARARIRLTKRIPVAAGLGGGSADAAAILRLLNDFWRLGLSRPALESLGAALGADVPACLRGRTAFVSGVGEVLADAPSLAGRAVLLVNPGVPLATAAVFRVHAERPPPRRDPPGRSDSDRLVPSLAARGNDLIAAAVELAPAVGTVLAALGSEPGARYASMSGSGATCFALFDDEEEAREAAGRIGRARPGWWTHAGRLL
ncbi:MAG TPA: 4-(cytidine 5'-diphospho)-2-C-methyl-D-erythritol kinase, partial [Beijerinckiaceae bacterium]|nr:4-(cytidine 5'-diphospho)-2-C-methyl-D-erythritol kinase [Beijerinckiaceae bacterium]